MERIRAEALKAGTGLMQNLRMNFFANYSAVVQAILSRIDAILNRVLKLLERDSQ
jgi:hypothetical protein